MIRISWALIAQHVDEWTGTDLDQGVAVLESRVREAVDTIGLKPEAVEHWHTDFLTPVVDSLRTDGAAALARGESWTKAAGPFLASASHIGTTD
ncbi:hypothetical protein ACIPRD_02960 [Streptomyces sp. NPDC090108]|uniref:hypothetical protein n=1 Tax=Streptomyces sp. NPDC090108 TaxID=3365947 RepID=UPI003826A8EE